jgi:hypothetical protein
MLRFAVATTPRSHGQDAGAIPTDPIRGNGSIRGFD